MFICICNAITDQQISDASRNGATTVAEAYQALGAQICCGQCRCVAQEIIEESRSVPVLPAE
jgi:bacterioferritin-associated ferredoxin